MSPNGSKTGVTSTRREFLIGNLCVILCMMGARRWPKSAVELPPGQMQFGRPPTHQAGLVILRDAAIWPRPVCCVSIETLRLT